MIKIKIDSREQQPLVFTSDLISSTEIGTIKCGDYGCIAQDGYELPIYFERKSINDLYGTLSKGYERFKKEIERSKLNNWQLIIIVESSLTRILQGVNYSQRTPQSIVRQVFTILARYNIKTVFCTSREESAEYITQFYYAHIKEYNNYKNRNNDEKEILLSNE